MAKKFKDIKDIEEIYRRIKDILLAHQGTDNAITSKGISSMLGLPTEDDTQFASRTIIWETASRYNLPVVAHGKGYFIATSPDEIASYNANIQRRIAGMQKTRDMVNKNFANWEKTQEELRRQ